jgi:hypothetical protein
MISIRSIKGFDIFRKVDQDHSHQTVLGAVVTIVAIVVIAFMFGKELLEFSRTTIERQTVIDNDRGAKMLQINLNITFHHMPCAILSLDQTDALGVLKEDITGAVNKIRLTEQGEIIKEPYNLKQVSEYILSREQCRLEGILNVSKAPGNFHFSSHAQELIMNSLSPELKSLISPAHTINTLFFGRSYKNEYISTVFGAGEQTDFSPYDGFKSLAERGEVERHEYYLSIIPIQYIDQLQLETQYSYKFAMNYSKRKVEAPYSSVYFRYNLENITMRYTLVYKPLSSFLTHICAIIGGAYAVIGIIHSILQILIK